MPPEKREDTGSCECWDCAHRWDARDEWTASRCPKCESKNVVDRVEVPDA